MSWRMSTRSDPRPGRPGTRWWVSVGVISAAVLAASYSLSAAAGGAFGSLNAQVMSCGEPRGAPKGGRATCVHL
jgi:hypothetical protein